MKRHWLSFLLSLLILASVPKLLNAQVNSTLPQQNQTPSVGITIITSLADPKNYGALYDKARCYALQGNVDLAVANLRQAINLSSIGGWRFLSLS